MLRKPSLPVLFGMTSSPTDWLIGEDVIPNETGNDGFRNMGDPAEFGDPSDYSLRYTGTSDNGGVHSNSGISNHAYYLAVNGGRTPRAPRTRPTACC